MKFLIIALLLFSCGSDRFQKSPIDIFTKQFDQEKSYSVLLYDIDVQGNFSKEYLHQYKIILEKDGTPTEEITEWMPVSESFFFENENNMGMEVLSKTEDGKISRKAAPAGYNNYIGNKKYGQWVNQGGSSFWQFYGQFAFMNSMFNLMSRPVYRSHYSDYNSNYRYRNPYYGPKSSGSNYYGTYSKNNSRANQSAFREKLSRVKQSSSSFRDRVKSRFNKQSSRSSGRYGSSFRSSSRGFGK
jgi:hypothetical protein